MGPNLWKISHNNSPDRWDNASGDSPVTTPVGSLTKNSGLWQQAQSKNNPWKAPSSESSPSRWPRGLEQTASSSPKGYWQSSEKAEASGSKPTATGNTMCDLESSFSSLSMLRPLSLDCLGDDNGPRSCSSTTSSPPGRTGSSRRNAAARRKHGTTVFFYRP